MKNFTTDVLRELMGYRLVSIFESIGLKEIPVEDFVHLKGAWLNNLSLGPLVRDTLFRPSAIGDKWGFSYKKDTTKIVFHSPGATHRFELDAEDKLMRHAYGPPCCAKFSDFKRVETRVTKVYPTGRVVYSDIDDQGRYINETFESNHTDFEYEGDNRFPSKETTSRGLVSTYVLDEDFKIPLSYDYQGQQDYTCKIVKDSIGRLLEYWWNDNLVLDLSDYWEHMDAKP